jgi:hypothetical protein
VNRVNISILAALWAGFSLSACNKAPEPAPAQTSPAARSSTDEAPLARIWILRR